jgi:hypothetical protein
MGICERFAKRQVTDSENPTAEIVYQVWNDADNTYADEAAAYAALVALPIPSTYTFPSGKVARLSSIAISDIDEASWDFKVSYSYNAPKEDDEVEFEFNIGIQDVTVTHALATTAYTGGGRTAPNFQRGVNISTDGKVQGVSTGLPTFAFSVVKHWALAHISPAYLIAVKGLAGKFNNAGFQPDPFPSPFAAGTVRFVGAQGKPTGLKFPISYRFEFQENTTEAVADITGIAKLGWQYLDIYRRVISDTASSKRVEVPHSVYVHTLPPGPGDFSILGL